MSNKPHLFPWVRVSAKTLNTELNQYQPEALAVLLGGGQQHYDEGYKQLLAIRKRQLKEYMKRVESAGFGERFTNGRSPLPKQYASVA